MIKCNDLFDHVFCNIKNAIFLTDVRPNELAYSACFHKSPHFFRNNMFSNFQANFPFSLNFCSVRVFPRQTIQVC